MALVRTSFARLIFIALVFLSSACTRQGLLHAGRLNDELLHDVAARTSRIRGLSLRAPLLVEITEPTALREELRARLTESVDSSVLQAEERFYRGLGLLPLDISLSELLVELLTAQTAGYYDAEKRVMRLVEGNTQLGGMLGRLGAMRQRDIEGEFLLSHEIAHALSDQHFNLRAYMRSGSNGDADAARAAFVEGEAMLVGLHLILGAPPRRVAGAKPAWGQTTEPDANWSKVPIFIRRQLLFSYESGLHFALALYESGGMPSLNRAYIRPPESTEQILHPEKYIREDDSPILVSAPEPLAEWNWARPVTEDTYGELGILALLEEGLGYEEAAVAASGWGGDRYALYRLGQSESALGFAWNTHWDEAERAGEFQERMAHVLACRFSLCQGPFKPSKQGELKSEPDSMDWGNEHGQASLRRIGERDVEVRIWFR